MAAETLAVEQRRRQTQARELLSQRLELARIAGQFERTGFVGCRAIQ